MIIPPRDLWGSIQDIRRKYDKHVHRWMPHINLIYPFRASSEFSKLEFLFKATCEKFKSFEIGLHRFNYFRHGKQKFTLWLKPEPGDLIKSLQNKILEIVPDCNDVNLHKNGFTPHLSVGQIQGEDKLKDLFRKLQDNWSTLKFSLTSIYFIAREDQKYSEFKIKKEFKLK